MQPTPREQLANGIEKQIYQTTPMTRSRAKYPCIKLDCITQQLNHRKIPEHGTAKLEYKERHSSERTRQHHLQQQLNQRNRSKHGTAKGE